MSHESFLIQTLFVFFCHKTQLQLVDDVSFIRLYVVSSNSDTYLFYFVNTIDVYHCSGIPNMLDHTQVFLFWHHLYQSCLLFHLCPPFELFSSFFVLFFWKLTYFKCLVISYFCGTSLPIETGFVGCRLFWSYLFGNRLLKSLNLQCKELLSVCYIIYHINIIYNPLVTTFKLRILRNRLLSCYYS